MSILDNELVRKYFGCRAVCTEAHFINVGYDEHERCISARILDAMQQPIRKGERVLILDVEWGVQDTILAFDNSGFHFDVLRLPDSFQKQECIVCDGTVGKGAHLCDEHGRIWLGRKPTPSPEKCRYNHGTGSECDCKTKDAVEEKMDEMFSRLRSYKGYFKYELRDLVRLVAEREAIKWAGNGRLTK